MANKLWKAFDRLTEQCYLNMIGTYPDASCWHQAFDTLTEIVMNERQDNQNFARECNLLDEVTDYAYDIGAWLEDYLDELDMRQEYEKLLESCDWLLQHFDWQEDSPSDLRFMKSVTLNSLGKTEEMNIFCQQWMEQEPDNIVAASALVYAKLAQKDLVAAEEIVERFIKEDTSCNEENDILFTAAEKVYQMNGNKKKQKQIQSAMKEYEEYLENYYNGTDFDEDDLEEEWDLPFC